MVHLVGHFVIFPFFLSFFFRCVLVLVFPGFVVLVCSYCMIERAVLRRHERWKVLPTSILGLGIFRRGMVGVQV